MNTKKNKYKDLVGRKVTGRGRLIIGLMSGTSVDGIDAVLVRVDGRGAGYRVEVLRHVEHEWPRRVRERLLAAMAPAWVMTEDICELNVMVAREFARAVEELLLETGAKRDHISAIASHGQTICHLPPKQAKIKSRWAEEATIGSTLQLGSVPVIAALTGIVTVGDFRLADMAVGGQGAPLVPWADAMLLSHEAKVRCVQNIGGIANVTWLPARSGQWSVVSRQKVVAFDTGPGNMVMDGVVSLATGGRERFDREGRRAEKGKLDERLFGELRRHAYFVRRPPKSTGREEFGAGFAKELMGRCARRKVSVENVLHTLARWTAWSIADAYRRFLPRMPEEVILCGGGAENSVLVGMLGEELGGGIQLRRIDEFGIPNKAKEAASFALLGAATLDGVAGNLPSVTGARRGVVLGVVADPAVRR